jgi:hypothetical protein
MLFRNRFTFVGPAEHIVWNYVNEFGLFFHKEELSGTTDRVFGAYSFPSSLHSLIRNSMGLVSK